MAKPKDLVDEFLRAGVAAEQARQLAERRRRTRIIAGLVIGLAVMSALAVVAIWFAVQTSHQAADLEAAATTDAQRLIDLSTSQAETGRERDAAIAERDRADRQTQLARSRQLAVEATGQLDNDLLLALLLSAQASHYADSFEARDVLLSAVVDSRRLNSFLLGQSGSVLDLVLDSEGRPFALTRCEAQRPGHLRSDCREGQIYVWDVENGQAQGPPIAGYAAGLSSWDLSSDGRTLALASCEVTSEGSDGKFCIKGGVRLWNALTGQPLGEVLAGDWVRSLAFSPDGQILASGHCLVESHVVAGQCEDYEIRLWDVPQGSPRATLDFGAALNLTFSPDGKTLASGSDPIVLWDAVTGKLMKMLAIDDSTEITSMAFSPDGQILAAAGADREIRFWDVEGGVFTGSQRSGHTEDITDLAFSSDGQIMAAASADRTITLWDMDKREWIEQPLQGHLSGVSSVVLSSDGKALISGGLDGAVILWDVTQRQPLGEPLADGHRDKVTSLAMSQKEPLLSSGSTDGTVMLWDISTRQPAGEPLDPHGDAVLSVAFSPNGQMLASGSGDGTIILWDVASRSPLGPPLGGGAHGVMSLAFSPDGNTLASGSYGTILLRDLAIGPQAAITVTAHSGWVQAVAFSPDPDAPVLASGGLDGRIVLWDPATGQPLDRPTMEPASSVWSLAFHRNGRMLASGGSNGVVVLWDVESGKPLGEPLAGHTRAVQSVAFSPDGKMLASGSEDDTIILWDVDSHRMLGEPLTGHTWNVSSVVFSPDGRLLVSGSLDATVRIWELGLEAWQARACRIANRNLTAEEWDLLVGSDVPYQCTCTGLPPGEGVPSDACQHQDG